MKRSSAGLSSATSEPRAKRQTTLDQGSFAFPRLTGISQEIHDRSSVFKAFFVPCTQFDEATAFLKVFRLTAHCDHVDHVMIAYRFNDRETGHDLGHDDDGERFSGKKLADLLEAMDMLGLVVVTRSYGGILLGPIRFQHITQCARESIMAYKHNRSLQTGDLDRTRRLLSTRDKTIEALRGMIHRAQEESRGDDRADVIGSQSSIVGSQGNAKKYETQGSEVLKGFLAARDLTIKSLRLKLSGMPSTQTYPADGNSPPPT